MKNQIDIRPNDTFIVTPHALQQCRGVATRLVRLDGSGTSDWSDMRFPDGGFVRLTSDKAISLLKLLNFDVVIEPPPPPPIPEVVVTHGARIRLHGMIDYVGTEESTRQFVAQNRAYELVKLRWD